MICLGCAWLAGWAVNDEGDSDNATDYINESDDATEID